MNNQRCVYLPSFKKTIKLTKPAIYQTTRINEWVKNELLIVNEIKKIENYNIFFYVFNNSAEIVLKKSSEKDEYFEQMEEIEEFKNSMDQTLLLEFDGCEIIYFENYLKALSSPTKYIYGLIDIYCLLVASIEKMISVHIVHNCICLDNILVNSFGKPVLKDFMFGLYINTDTDTDKNITKKDNTNNQLQKQLKMLFGTYDPSYKKWPVEIHILCYLHTNKLTSLSRHNIETVLNDTGNKDSKDCYFHKYVNWEYNKIVSDILQFFETWDNYALSILFIDFLRNNFNINNRFIKGFHNLLVCNTLLNPLQRTTIRNIQINFEKLLDTIEIDDYKDIKCNNRFF